MMAPNAGPLLPLVITCLVFVGGFSSLPTAPGRTRSLLTAPFQNTEDYSQYEDVTPAAPLTPAPGDGAYEPCDYNPCLEDQVPCADLAAATRCLCPGLTPHTQLPDPPDLRSASWNGSEVVIRWCAPSSHVTEYRVTVGGEERGKFGKEQRSGGVGSVEDVSNVCLVAANDVGESDASCVMYQGGGGGVALKAGLVGGAVVLLLLAALLLLLWRRKGQSKERLGAATSGAADAQ